MDGFFAGWKTLSAKYQEEISCTNVRMVATVWIAVSTVARMRVCGKPHTTDLIEYNQLLMHFVNLDLASIFNLPHISVNNRRSSSSLHSSFIVEEDEILPTGNEIFSAVKAMAHHIASVENIPMPIPMPIPISRTEIRATWRRKNSAVEAIWTTVWLYPISLVWGTVNEW